MRASSSIVFYAEIVIKSYVENTRRKVDAEDMFWNAQIRQAFDFFAVPRNLSQYVQIGFNIFVSQEFDV